MAVVIGPDAVEGRIEDRPGNIMAIRIRSVEDDNLNIILGTGLHHIMKGGNIGVETYANILQVEGYDKRDPRAYRTPPPMTALSYRSKLIEIASSGKHHDVKVDPVSLRRLIAWVDTMCPYRGDEEVRAIEDPVFQGVDWLSIRPKVRSAPTIIRPGPVD